MTIIAYKAGIMAADSVVITGDIREGKRRKIVRTPEGALCAAAGLTTEAAAFQAWCCDRTGDKPHLDEHFVGWLVTAEGEIRVYDRHLQFFVLTAPFFATGSGCEIAQGAMAFGASAEQAVRIAIEHCVSCGGPIQVETIGIQP